MRIELADTEIDRAHNQMTAARRRLGDYRSPCMDNPRLFDAQNGEIKESWAQFSRRAAIAIEMCVTWCRVFDQCQRLRRADPGIRGICAGVVIEDD